MKRITLVKTWMKIPFYGLLFILFYIPPFFKFEVFAGAIIVDHNAVQQFEQIPDEYIEKAKQLTIHYGHTSHGSQITTGLLLLESMDPKYSVAIRTNAASAGLPAQENPPALRIYDGNPSETYIEPNDYWDGDLGLNRTRAVVNSGVFNFSIWSWCGQQSSNSAATVDRYLNALDTLEKEYPAMRFIYMTGHTDGGSANLTRNNAMVRDYVTANDKILFDFADIESWDLDGNYYPNTTDACGWCSNWCNAHPEDCNFECSCAHSQKYNCLLKAKAFWWLMARLAGWNPQSSKDGVIMEHGKYSESYMSNWAELPTGKELIQKNLAKNIKAGLGLSEEDPFDLKTGIGFQPVYGEQIQMVKVWKEGEDKELHIGNLAYKVSWNSAGSGDNILFYIEGYDRVVIENFAVIQADADYRQKNTFRIVGCEKAVIRNAYFAGAVSQAHIHLDCCQYVVLENIEIAGIDYFGKGVYRNGEGIAVTNAAYSTAKQPKLLKWLTIQNCYIHDLDDGEYPQGDPNWRNQDGILLESPMDGILFNCYFENWKVKYGDAAIDAGHRGYRYPEGAAYSPDPDDPVSHFFRIERNIINNCSHCKSPGYDNGNILFWANNLFINSSYTDYHYGFKDYFVHNTYIFDSQYEFDYFLTAEPISTFTPDLAYFHNCLFYFKPSTPIRKFNTFISQHWKDTYPDRWEGYHADYNIYHIGIYLDYWVERNNAPGNNITLDEWKSQGNDSNSFIDVWETLGDNLLVNTIYGNSGEFTDWTNDNPDGWNIYGENVSNKITEEFSGKCRLISSDGNYISMKQAVLNEDKLYKYGININNVFSAGIEIMEDGPGYYYKGNYTGYIKAKPADKGNFTIKRLGKSDVTFDDVWVKQVTTDLPEENYFINYSVKDFRLVNNSPAAGAGSIDYLGPADFRMKVTQDFYGTSRGVNPSCGAFENYSEAGGLTGDVNGNGKVDIQDMQACVNVLLGIETRSEVVDRAKQTAEPVNECDVLDIQEIVNVILGN